MLALATSMTTVGRAQFLAGIVILATVQGNNVSKLAGYANSVFGGIAIIYNFLTQNFNKTIAQTLEDLSIFAKMSALGSGLISLTLFENS